MYPPYMSKQAKEQAIFKVQTDDTLMKWYRGDAGGEESGKDDTLESPDDMN